MSYPIIDGLPEEEQVIKLAEQVSELLKKGSGFIEALTAVTTHRYAGRYQHLREKVRKHLSARSTAVVKKQARERHRSRGQTEFAGM